MRKITTPWTASRAAAILSLGLVAAGCEVKVDRAGYADAWYYERLTPYYTNDLSTNPRTRLLAVRELVGESAFDADGSIQTVVDYYRSDIELFFGAPVAAPAERIRVARTAIRETCPLTKTDALEDRVAFSAPRYLVLKDVPCDGPAGERPREG